MSDSKHFRLYQKYKRKYKQLLGGSGNLIINKLQRIINNSSDRKQLMDHLSQLDSKLANNDNIFSQVNLTDKLSQITKQLSPEQFQNGYQIFQKYIDYSQYPNILRYLTMITSDSQINSLKLLIGSTTGSKTLQGGSDKVQSLLNGIFIIFILSLISYCGNQQRESHGERWNRIFELESHDPHDSQHYYSRNM